MVQHRYRNSDLSWLPSFDRMVGPKPPDDFASDGATDAPDVVWGHDLRPAGHFHDYDYSSLCRELGIRDERARYEADQFFLENLRRCGLKRLRYVYYFRVRLWGHMFFAYDTGCEPRRTPWFWLRLFFGRYASW